MEVKPLLDSFMEMTSVSVRVSIEVTSMSVGFPYESDVSIWKISLWK